MSNNIEVKEIRNRNYDEIIKVFKNLSHESLRLRFGARINIEDYVKNLIESAYAIYGIYVNGELVGIGESYLLENNNDTVEIAIEIEDRYQGKGLGTLLLNYMINDLKSKGVKKVITYVAVDNCKCLKLIEKFKPQSKTFRHSYGMYYIEFDLSNISEVKRTQVEKVNEIA